ncbi:MAG TPA: TMEM175 family protein [Gemmatimonadaceae bacterium]|nr:TMEM175 family protein [Gemmatimonadaceae bacterium]
MTKTRLEAFSDGVIAILITIMVLELHAPHGADWGALRAAVPSLLTYVLSFVFVGIYWNNHHHMLQATERINGAALWANLHLLFWLSLIPFVTSWMDDAHNAAVPTAAYGIVLLMCAIAFTILQRTILAAHLRNSRLAEAVGSDFKGKVSLLFYLTAIPLAFVHPAIADALYVMVALIWFVPDSRIESRLQREAVPERELG